MIRFLLTALVVSALAWAARRALIRWIDGPPEQHSTAPWGPIAAPAAAPEAPVGVAHNQQQPPLGASWAAPGQSGACPEGHLVKVKLSSRLYHLPGMAAYARTTPDRCYPTAEAAEEDGFTRAKR